MRILYDITTLGQIHCAANANPAGIYVATRSMGAALDQLPELELYLCAARESAASAMKYLRDTGDFRPEQFLLDKRSLPAEVSGAATQSVAGASNLRHSSDYRVEQALRSYSPEKIYNSVDIDVYHVNWRGRSELPDYAKPAVLLTVFDIISIKRPDWFVEPGCPNPIGEYLHKLLLSLRPGQFINVNTEAVKNDILFVYPHISSEQMFITPLGVAPHIYHCDDGARLSAVKEQYGIPADSRYLLCVNTLEPRKNMLSAIEAYFELVSRPGMSDLALVLVGSSGWLSDDVTQRLRQRGDAGARVILTGFVPDGDMAALYSGASAFCYPSLDEGFGMPVLEAMKCGVPVVSSNRAPLREVASDAALCADPLDKGAIADALYRILNEPELASSLVQKGTALANQHSWERCAESLAGVYSAIRPTSQQPRRHFIGGSSAGHHRNEVQHRLAFPQLTLPRKFVDIDSRPAFSGLKQQITRDSVFLLTDGSSLSGVPRNFLAGQATLATSYCREALADAHWKPDFYYLDESALSPDEVRLLNACTGSTMLVSRAGQSQFRTGTDVIDVPNDGNASTTPDSLLQGAEFAVARCAGLARQLGFRRIVIVPPASGSSDSPATADSSRGFSGTMKDWLLREYRRAEQQGCEILQLELDSYPAEAPHCSLAQVADSDVLGECPRFVGASIDETEAIACLFRQLPGARRLMFDVGAHRGTSAVHFCNDDWQIYCFEPDPENRSHLSRRFGSRANVVIDPRAVSDTPSTGTAFFTSQKSQGISGLHAFHESHSASGTVDVTTVADAVGGYGVSRIDFLKIDVEGFDFSVLKGVPWGDMQPDVIECEYEDAKTRYMGHGWRDIAEYLQNRGYTVYISEWHPIVEYGVAHDWRRIVPYPGVAVAPDSWGNILAFLNDPGIEAIQSAFAESIKIRGRKVSGIDGAQPSGQDNRTGIATRSFSVDQFASVLSRKMNQDSRFYKVVRRVWRRIRQR